MRTYLFLPSLLLVGVLWFMPTTEDLAADQKYNETQHDAPSLESQNQMIKITDSGLSISELRMKKDDRIVFFFNDTTDSLLTLELSYGTNTTHCTSENLKVGDGGRIASTTPIVPKDFASSCFHDLGSYPFTIYGLKNYPEGLKGSITIE
jgi:hypothetical protein